MKRARLQLSCALGVLGLLACSPPVTTGSDAGAGVVPDFSLLDVNPASARSGQNVSPRDYEGRVSAWYFGHST